MSTADLAMVMDLPTDLILEILDAGLFGHTVQMIHGRPVYAPEAVSIVKNVAELAEEVAVSRCSPFAAWFLLRFGLRP